MEAEVVESVDVGDYYTPRLLASAALVEQIEVGVEYAARLLKRAAYWEFCAVSQYLTLDGELRARYTEGLRVSDAADFGRRDPLQYAVNVATGALTSYQGFDFSSFARIGGQLYGAKADGIYLIAGEGDDGAPISAWIDFGDDDMDESYVKQIDVAWLGLGTDAQCFLRVTADSGRERIYRVQGASTRRAKLKSGVRGRTWRVVLELVDASYAKLDFVELNVGLTQRRFARYSP